MNTRQNFIKIVLFLSVTGKPDSAFTRNVGGSSTNIQLKPQSRDIRQGILTVII